MFVRLLFLLLLALNLGAAAWLLFGRAPVESLPPPTNPGVPELRLLSETPRAARPAGASTTAEPRERDACTTLGPFMTAVDMRAAVQALSPRVARIQYREESLRRSHGYWVYLPAAASREAALDEAARCSDPLRLRQAMLDHLRLSGGFAPLLGRARAKALALAEAGAPPSAPALDAALGWYFEQRLRQPVPRSLAAHAAAGGHADEAAFRAAVWDEYRFARQGSGGT